MKNMVPGIRLNSGFNAKNTAISWFKLSLFVPSGWQISLGIDLPADWGKDLWVINIS
jgi:hypothetical protein